MVDLKFSGSVMTLKCSKYVFYKTRTKEVQSSLQEIHLKYNNPERLKIKGKHMYHAKINQGKI